MPQGILFVWLLTVTVCDALVAQTSTWNIRRCCAIVLDTIGVTFEEAVVPYLLETLSACFREVPMNHCTCSATGLAHPSPCACFVCCGAS